MLSGLIFATNDADDRAGALAATLPFAGLTLIEYQVRLLAEAGAGHILVAVSRMTPELLGALGRLGRRGVTVDVVRNAAEAMEKLHPLAQVIIMADGLVTAGDIVEAVAEGEGDALLVMADAPPADGYARNVFERVGAGRLWAGLARAGAKRVAEVAALPGDYDFQSALLRVLAQNAPAELLLPHEPAHGIEHSARALARRGEALLAGVASRARGWAERLVIAPLARLLLPRLMAAAVPSAAVTFLAALVAGGGLFAGWVGYGGVAVAAALVAMVGVSSVEALASLRDEGRLARLVGHVPPLLAALVLVLMARDEAAASATMTAPVLAIVAIAAAAMLARLIPADGRRGWWITPAGAMLAILLPAAFGLVLPAIVICALYAGLSLAAAIEDARQKP